MEPKIICNSIYLNLLSKLLNFIHGGMIESCKTLIIKEQFLVRRKVALS